MEKTALVTGGSSGIGLQVALSLARDGYVTTAGVRDPNGALELKGEASNEDLAVNVVRMDVTDPQSVHDAIMEASNGGQRLDVLVNNAGYGQLGCMEDVPVDDFRKQFETNFFGIIDVMQKALPIMRKCGSGKIVNISSIVGRIGLPGSCAYISSKFALEGLTECLRYELGVFGIRVTSIEPGVIKTRFLESMKMPKLSRDAQYTKIINHVMAGLKMMVDMGTPPARVAEVVMEALHAEEMAPRYLVGPDAEMFMKARMEKTDTEFERYMSKELFPA